MERFSYPFNAGPLDGKDHVTWIQLDNSTAVAYINHWGETQFLQPKEKTIRFWLEPNLMFQPCPPCTSQAWRIGRRTSSIVNVGTQIVSTLRCLKTSVAGGNAGCGPPGFQVQQQTDQVCLQVPGSTSLSSSKTPSALALQVRY